jgi:DNA-binding MarR family transcriptional regulator
VERRDDIDAMLDQWAWAPYDVPLVPMAIAKRIARLARRLDDLATASLAPYGLERAEFDVLVTLLRSGPAHEMTPTSLNRYLLLSSGGLTKRLTRLEQRGFVARRLDPDDRRSLLVALTAEGKALTESAVSAHTAALTSLVAGLPDADREQLASLLRDVVLDTDAGTGTAPGLVTATP